VDSLREESHEGGLLEYPVYTKPATWRGREVPAVLLSGHHAQVERWRHEQRLLRTAYRRPDLIAHLDPAGLPSADRAVLAAAGWTCEGSRFRPPGGGVAD
jgi:tRNA (guanine37-N1)-methyltransferase